MRGVFITFEGPEGCGKTTQIRRLSERLTALGVQIVQPRDPGGTPTGEVLRDVLLHGEACEPIGARAEALLFAASRAQLVHGVIRPALGQGACVLCDRFADSTTAYQGCGREVGIDDMIALNAFAIDGVQPDVTVLLDVDVQTGFRRVASRNDVSGATHDRFERENVTFHERVRAGYLELSRRFADRIRVVDAARDESSVAQAVWRIVSDVFERAGRPLTGEASQ